MNRRCAVYAIASLFDLAMLCGAASAQGVEDQIKKLEIDRAAAVVKGDLATLESGEICTRWNERESTWRKSGSCHPKVQTRADRDDAAAD